MQNPGPVCVSASLVSEFIRPEVIDAFTYDVHDPAEGGLSDRHRYGRTRVDRRRTPDESVSGGHGDRPYLVVAEVRCDLKRNPDIGDALCRVALLVDR